MLFIGFGELNAFVAVADAIGAVDPRHNGFQKKWKEGWEDLVLAPPCLVVVLWLVCVVAAVEHLVLANGVINDPSVFGYFHIPPPAQVRMICLPP